MLKLLECGFFRAVIFTIQVVSTFQNILFSQKNLLYQNIDGECEAHEEPDKFDEIIENLLPPQAISTEEKPIENISGSLELQIPNPDDVLITPEYVEDLLEIDETLIQYFNVEEVIKSSTFALENEEILISLSRKRRSDDFEDYIVKFTALVDVENKELFDLPDVPFQASNDSCISSQGHAALFYGFKDIEFIKEGSIKGEYCEKMTDEFLELTVIKKSMADIEKISNVLGISPENGEDFSRLSTIQTENEKKL